MSGQKDDEFPPGKVINARWQIEKKIGKGCCGAVYKVLDLEKKHKAALKIEKHNEDKELQVLKKEVDVLQLLKQRKHVPRLICSGRREAYDYLVMTLCGKNLFDLKKDCNLGKFSAGCVSRVAIQVLYGIKQLHEVGYLHRDIKPANMVVGRGKEARVVYVIDYGMARKFAIWTAGKPNHRKPREKVLLRGTHRYCSPFVHDRMEQGRRDDIYSLLYAMIFLHTSSLPWMTIKDESEIAKLKKEITDATLLEGCPQEWLDILKHIRSLSSIEQRPDYKLLYEALRGTMNRLNINFSDPYDWEIVDKTNRTQSQSLNTSLEGKNYSHEECKKPLEPVKNLPSPTSAAKKEAASSHSRSSQQQRKKATSPGSKEGGEGSREKTEVDSSRINPLLAVTDPLAFQSNDIGI